MSWHAQLALIAVPTILVKSVLGALNYRYMYGVWLRPPFWPMALWCCVLAWRQPQWERRSPFYRQEAARR